MKKIIYLGLLLFLFVLTTKTAESQVFKSFTDSSFVSQINLYFQIDPKKPDSVIVPFVKNWESGIFSTSEKTKIIFVANYLHKRRLNKQPDFKLYFAILNIFPGKSKSNYEIWLDKMANMNNETKYSTPFVKDFLFQTYKLISKNQIFTSPSISWKSSSPNFSYISDIQKDIFKIQFSNINLICINLKDTVEMIKNTSGIYDFTKKIWTGSDGKSSWERNGFSINFVYAKLNKYQIKMTGAEYTADSVTFSNTKIFEREFLGKLTDKISSYVLKEKSYPTFVSYNHDIELNNLIENVDFSGGISMQGSSLFGSGTDLYPALIVLKRKGGLFLKAKAKSIKFSPKVVLAKDASVVLYLSKSDSVIHSCLDTEIGPYSFKLINSNTAYGNTNYFSSFHQMEIDLGKLEWKNNDTTLLMYGQENKATKIYLANFYSIDYFTTANYNQLQMQDSENPLMAIQRYIKYLTAIEKIRESEGDFEKRKTMKIPMEGNIKTEDILRIGQSITNDEIIKFKVSGFIVSDFAEFWKKDPVSVAQRLAGLSYGGFLTYNSETQQVTIRPKLYHYTQSNYAKKDYDVISIESKVNANENAIMDLSTLDIYVTGVENVVLSGKKRVGFEPSKKTILIQKNRGMIFDGWLNAGLVNFYGENFKFDYAKFQVSFEKVDSAKLYFKLNKRGVDGTFPIKRLRSTIEKISGVIEIDKSSNKSGRDTTTSKYPILTSKEKTFVYYDKKDKVTYNRKKFYFENTPFSLDSLNELKGGSFSFKGKLFAAGIVPDFEETISIQKDSSLGFVHKTPDGGLKLFGNQGSISNGNGKINSTIKLNNSGVSAGGQIQWLTATIYGDKFSLFPDSLNTDSKTISINSDKNSASMASYPEVSGDSIYVHWEPKKEFITFKSNKKPLKMYNEKSIFAGILNYTHKNLTGKGKFEIKEGKFNSDKYLFSENSLITEKSNFSISASNEAGETLNIKDAKSYVDILAEKAVIQSNTKNYNTVFTKNIYNANTDHCVWKVGERVVDFDSDITTYTNPTKEEDKKKALDKNYLLNKANFTEELFKEIPGRTDYVSFHRDQDSLRLSGTKSVFDAQKNILRIKSVSKIEVADIVVRPESDVVINQGASMEQLLSTNITVGNKHRISNVNIVISGRNEYKASSGTYAYIDENKTIQNISFSSITYNVQTKRSEAKGVISDKDGFKLSSYFDYRGDVEFYADNDYLLFNGFSRIKHTCKTKPYWFFFKSRINPDSVYLPLAPDLHSIESLNKANIFASLLFTQDSTHVYSSFLSNMEFTGESILSVRDSSYFVCFDKTKNKYRISTLEKLRNRELQGNYLDLDTKNCIVSGEGSLMFDKINSSGAGELYGQVKINAAGEVKDDMLSNKISLQTMFGFNFFFSDKLLEIIQKKLEENGNLGGVDPTRDIYKKNLTQILGSSVQANEVISEIAINQGQLKKMPPKLTSTLFFSDLKLDWNTKSKSFKSSGKIGLGSLNKTMINKYVDGCVEIDKTRNAERLTVYFETNSNEWFYFTYYNGTMKTISSVAEYNELLEKLKDKDRKMDVVGMQFSYYLGNEMMKTDFIRRFKASDNNDDEGGN